MNTLQDFTSLTLADAGTLVYEGQTSVAFYLDINQTGTGSEQPYYEIHALEIYTSASADHSSYRNVLPLYRCIGQYTNSTVVLRLQPDNTKGTSNWDAGAVCAL